MIHTLPVLVHTHTSALRWKQSAYMLFDNKTQHCRMLDTSIYSQCIGVCLATKSLNKTVFYCVVFLFLPPFNSTFTRLFLFI